MCTGYVLTRNITDDTNPDMIAVTHTINIISNGMVIGSVMNSRINNTNVSNVFMIVPYKNLEILVWSFVSPEHFLIISSL